MQSSQVRNVGLDLVPSTSGPSHDTPKELPLWMLDPKKFPLDWLTFNRSNIVRCTKEYTRELLRWRRCQQYSTASRLKGVLKRIMMFLHTHMRYVDGKNLIDCELEEELITLVSMYADMELKVWLKKRDGLLANGEQAVREYQRRSTNSIAHWLYTMLSEHAHRVDTLLSIQTVYSRHTRPVLDPIFRKVLWEITDTSLTDVTYVRYMLAYKVWHERVLVAEDEASRTLTEHLVNHLVPMNNYTRFSPALRGCLCKTPRNVDNVARFHMIPNNINLRKACDDFLKHCRVPLDEINFGSISLIDDDFEDMLSDEDAEVKELMKLISDRQEAKEMRNADTSRSRDANNAPIVSFVDLTEPEPITQASTSRETSSAAYIDLTSDDDEKPTAQSSSSSKKPLVAPPAPTSSAATKSPMMEACCGRPYREEEDVYMHPNLVNFIFMCPLRRREYGRSKLEIRHMCQETKARCGCMKPAPTEDKHTAKMSSSSFEDMPSCFQFAKTEEFSYMNEDEVDDEDVQPPQVINQQQQQQQQQQLQQQALMIKRESLPSSAATDNVMCNNTSGQDVIDCDADDDESFCDTLFAGSLTVCDKNNTSAERTYAKSVSELNKHVELTCERLQTHTPLKHNSTVVETSPSATKSTPPEANILGTYSRRLSEKLDKRKVLQQQSVKSNSCRREIKFSTPAATAAAVEQKSTDDEKTLNCHTHEEIRRIKLPVLESTGPRVQTELVETSEQQQERVRFVTARDMLNRLTLPQTEPSVSPETGQTPAEIEDRLSPEEHYSRAPSPETVLTRRSPEMDHTAETTQTDVLSRLTLPPETERSVTETERSVTETERTVAEIERSVTESERLVAETERTVAEIERSVTETERSLAETARSVTETERTVTETERTVTETERTVTETERTVTETESSVTEKSIPHESTIESIPCPQTETLPTESEISTNAEMLPAEEINEKHLPENESCIEDACREVEEIITATEEISVPEHTAEAENVVEQLTETTTAEETLSTASAESVIEEHPETFSATEIVEETVVVPSVDTVAENHEILNYETSEVVPEAVPEICVETEIVSNYETPEIILENTSVVSEQIVESFEVPEFEPVAETEVTTESTEEQLPSTENTEEQPETLPNTDLLPETEESLTVPSTAEAEIVENQSEEMTHTETPETESVEEVLDEVTISLAENVHSPADLKPACFETEISTETVDIASSETENLVENISVTETIQDNLPFPAEILPETSSTEEVHTTEMVELQREEIIHSEIQTSVAKEIFSCDMISEETVITTSYTSETVHEAEIQTEVIFPEECSEIEISSVYHDSDEKEVSLSVESVIEAETVVSEPVVHSNAVEIETESVLEFSASEEQAIVSDKSEKHVSECLNTASSKRRRKSPLNKIRNDYIEESQSKIEEPSIEDTRPKHDEPLASRRRRLSPASSSQLEKITVEIPAHRPEDTVLPSPARRGRPRKTPSVSRDSHSEDRSSRVVEETDFVGRLRSRRKTDITVEPVTEVLLKEASGKTEESTETAALTRRRKPGPASSKLRYLNTETLHHESVQPETHAAAESVSTSSETTPPEQLREDTDQSVEARSGLKHPKHRRKQTFKAFRSDTESKTLSKLSKKSESSSDIEARRRLVVTVQNLSEEEISNLMLPVTKLPVVTDKPVKQHTKRRKHKVPEDSEEKMSELLDKPVEVTEKPAEDPTSDNSTLEEELSLMERLLRTTEASSDKKLKKQRGRKPGAKKRDRELKTTSSSVHSDQKTSLQSDNVVQKSYSSESLSQKASNIDTCSQNTSFSLNLDKTAPSSQSSETNNTQIIPGLNYEDTSIISEESNVTTSSTLISEDSCQKTVSSSHSSEAISHKETIENTLQIATSKCKSTKASVKEYTSIQDNVMIESSHNSEEELQTAEETQTVDSTMLQDTRQTSPRLRELQLDESSQDKSLSEDDLPLTCRLENSRLKVVQPEDVAKKLRTSTSSHKSDRSAKNNTSTKTKRDLSKSAGESTKELKSRRDTSKSLESTRKDSSKNRRDSSRSTTDKYLEFKKDAKNRKTSNENKNTADKSEQDSSITGKDTSYKSNQKQDTLRRDSLKSTADSTHNPDLSMQEITSTEVVTKSAELPEGLKPEDKPEPALQSKVSVSETSRRKKTKSQHPKRDAQHKTSTETQADTKLSPENSLDKSDNSSKTAKKTEIDKITSKQKAKHTELQADVQVDTFKIQDWPVDKQTETQLDKTDTATTAAVPEPSTPQSTAKVTVSTPAITPSTPKTSAEGSRRRKLKKPVHSQDLKSRDTSLLVTEFTEERKPDQLPQNKVKPIQTSPGSSRSKKSSRSTSRNNDIVEEVKKNIKLSDQPAESVKDDKKLSRSSSKTSETNEDIVKEDKKNLKETKTDQPISDVTEVKENTNEKLTIKPFKIESKMKYSAKALKVRQKLSAFAADFSKKRKNTKDPDDIPLTQILVAEQSKFEPAAIVSNERTVNKMSIEETPLDITPTKSTKRKRTRLADIIRPKKSKLSFNVEEKVVKKPRGRPPKFPNQTAIKKELKEVTSLPAQPDLDASTLDEINEICQEIQIEIVSEPITSTVVEKPNEPVANLRLNGLSNIETPTKSVTIEEHTPIKKEPHKKGSKINQKEREIAKSLDSDSESNSELVIDTSAETSDEEEQTKMPSKRHWKKEKMYAMKNAQEKIAKSCVKENIQVSVIASSIVTEVVERVEEVALSGACTDEPTCEVTIQTSELTSETCIETCDAGLFNEGSNKTADSQEVVEPCAVPDIVESLPETKEVIEDNNEVIYTNDHIATTDVVSEEIILEKEPSVENITTEVSDISVPTDSEITEESTEITTVSEKICTEVETNTIIPEEPVTEVTAENVTEEMVSLPEDTEITPVTEQQVITEEIVISAAEIPTTAEEVCAEIQSVTENTESNRSEPVVAEETIVSEVVTEKLSVSQELCTETEIVTETVEECNVAPPETEIVEDISVAAPETETVEYSVAASETETVEYSVADPETETVEYSVAAPETETVEYSVSAPETETVEYSVAVPETETIEEYSVAAPETEIVEDINVAPAETESSVVIEEQTPVVSTEVIVEEIQAQEEHKTEENQPESTYNLQQNQDHLQITEEIVSEAHSKEEHVIIPENQVVELSDIPLPEETVITETSEFETLTETPASETENIEHQVPETEVPVQQAEISVVHEETVIPAVPEIRIPEISFAQEDRFVFEEAECAETDFSTAEMSVATVLDTLEPERHVAETTSVELEIAEVIVAENTVPDVEISAAEIQIFDNQAETTAEQSIDAVEPIIVRPPPVIHQAEIIEDFVVEDFCTTFELTSPVAEKMVEIVETNPPLTPVAQSMPVILESCIINTQTLKDYSEQVAKLATTKCSVNGLQKTNKPIMVRQVELIQHLQHIAETVDELIVPESEVGIAQETLELPECYMTAEASLAQVGTSTQVQAVEKYPPAEIPADENYNLNILAHMAFNLVHLDTKTENNNVLGSQELSLRTDDMCLFVMLPDKQEDTAPTATPVYVQKEGDTEKMVNIQKISTKGAALENKIQHLTELAAKKQPNPPRTAASGENFNDLLTSLEDMLEVDNRKTNTALPTEPEIPMIIPNTAHLHLIPDDDDFLMHQSAKKSPEKTQECFTLNLSLVSKSASQNKDTKTATNPLETSVPRDFYNEIENLDLSKTDEKKKTSKEGKTTAKSSKSKSKASKSSPVKPNIEASFLLSKYKSSYDKQSDTSAQQSSSNKNVISPPSYIRSTRPMRMVTTRKRKNDTQDKKTSTEEMFDKLLEEHKKEKAAAAPTEVVVVETGTTLEVQKPAKQEIHVESVQAKTTVLNSTLMKFPPDSTLVKDSTASGSTTKSPGTAKVGFSSSFSVASLLPEIASHSTPITAEKSTIKPSSTVTIAETSTSTDTLCFTNTISTIISTTICSTSTSCNATSVTSMPSTLVTSVSSTSSNQSSITSLLYSTPVPIQTETTIASASTVSPTKTPKSTKKLNILENIAVKIPVPPHDRSRGARLNIRDTLEFVKMPPSQEEIRISYVKPAKAVLSTTVDEERNTMKPTDITSSVNTISTPEVISTVNVTGEVTDKPDVIPLPVLEYTVPQQETVKAAETSDTKCLIPESVLNRSIEIVEKTIEALKQDNTSQQSEVTQEQINIKVTESIEIPSEEPVKIKPEDNTKLKETVADKPKPDTTIIQDDNSDTKDVKIPSDKTDSISKQDEATEQSNIIVEDVELIQEKSKPNVKQNLSSAEFKECVKILDETLESKHTDSKLKETVKPSQSPEKLKESIQEQSDTMLASSKETAPVVTEVEICTEETVIVEDIPSAKEDILAAETVKNQAVEVVTDWFDTKVAPEPYAEVTIEECQFFEEASNSSVISHSQTMGPSSVRKVYSKEYQTPDSGIAFDEDSVQKDKLETLTLADTEGYQSQTSPENLVEITAVPKTMPEPEVFKKPSLIVSIPLSKIQHTIDIIMKAKSEMMDETKTSKHKVETAPLVKEPDTKVVDKLRKRKPEPTVVQEVNEESGKISDKLRKEINEKLRKRKPETPIVEEVDKVKKKRIIAVPEPTVEVESVKLKKSTPSVPDKPTVTVDDKKKSTKKDVTVVEEVKPAGDVQKSVKPNQEKDAKSLVHEPVKKDVEKSKKPIETVKDTKKRAQNVVEETPQVSNVKDTDKIKKKRTVVPEDQADTVLKSEDKSKKRQHSITEDTPADTSTSTEAKDTERVKKKRHNISDHQQTDTASKEPIVEASKVVDKTKKRTPSASEDSQAENSDKELPKDSHIDYNWIKKRRPTSIVEEKKVETPEKDPLKNVDWIKKRRSSTTVEKPVEPAVKEACEQTRKRKHSTASDDRPADIASDSSDVLQNVDWIKKRRQSPTETAGVSTEKDTVDLIKKRRQSTVSEKSEASEKEKSVDWIKKRRQSVTDDTQSESEAGVKQDDYLTDKEWSSEEVMSPATSQATPVRSKGSKKEYPDCLFGITESPVPSASCCINSPYPSDISLQEEPTFYVEGGIDLCTDFQDQYYESFDSLKEQQSLQAGYSVVDEARKEQQSLQAGYCVVDSQFTLPEHMNDGDLISMIIENNMIIDKRMVAVNMHQVQPEMKPHASEEQKRSEFDDFEPDNHLSGIVDGICRNLDSETVEFCQIDPSLLTGHDNSEVQLISMDQANSEVQVVICESLQNMDSTLGTLLFDEAANTEIIQPGYTITTAVTEPAHINTETVTTTGDQDAKERVDYPNTALVEELPLCNHEIVIPMTTESDPVVPIPVNEEVIPPTALQPEPVPKVQPSTSYAQDDVIEATPKAQKPATSFSYIRAKDKKQEEMKKTVKRSTENDLFSFTTAAAANKTEKLLKIKLPTSQEQVQVVKTERSPKITSNADRLFENLKSQENIKEQTQKSPRIQAATSPKLISNADRLFDNLKSQKSGPIKVYTPRFASQKQNSTVKLGVDQKLPEPSPSTSKLSPEPKPVKIPEPKLSDIQHSSPKLPGPKAQEVKVYTKVYESKKSEPKVNQRRNTDYDFDSLLASGNQQQQRARTPKDYTRNGTVEPTKTGLKSSELNAETYRQRTTSTSSSSSTGEPSKYTFDQRKTTTAGGETSKYNFKPGDPAKYSIDIRRSTRYSPRIQVASTSTSRTASGTQKFPSARVPAEEAVARVPHRTHRSEPVYHMQRLDSSTYYDTNQATEAPTAAGSTTTAAPTKGVAIGITTNNNKNQPRRRQADEKMWLTNPKLTELVEAANSYYSNKY